MPITDQQWLDHTNQNNQEFANRQILLKGEGPPGSTPAPFGSFYKDKLNGYRYEQIELNPVNNGYNWQLFDTGGLIVDESKAIVDFRDCDASLIINDLVMESMSSPLKVDKVIDNLDPRIVIGLCIGKENSTTAKVLFQGSVVLTGFLPGQKIYCGTNGEITSTVPVFGYLQILGNTSDGTRIDFKPSTFHIKRT